MALHVVIGKGKLGVALTESLTRKGEEVRMFSQSTGFSYPNPVGIKPVLELNPDYVWCCVGAGSVNECAQNYNRAMLLHVCLPTDLLRLCVPKTKVVLFSTDYVADEMEPWNPKAFNPNLKSLYALSKFTMEQHFNWMARKNATCVRVGNLYSSRYFPEKSFPMKAIQNSAGKVAVHFPENEVTPTPVEWLAQYLCDHLKELFAFGPMIHHVAPDHSISVLNWARSFIPQKIELLSSGIDPNRPHYSALGCSLGKVPTWSDLWVQYGRDFTEYAGRVL